MINLINDVNNYKLISDSLKDKISIDNTKESHPYIEPNQSSLYGIIDALLNKNLIKENYSICDIGFGLGTSLYNIHRQSIYNKLNIKFTGIEYDSKLIELFNFLLRKKWSDIEIINDTLFNIDYSKYDFIYMYSPLRDTKLILDGYKKIISEMREGSILFERYNYGRGLNNILFEYCEENNISTDYLYFGNTKNLLISK